MRSLRWHILRVLILTITLTVSLSLALGYFATKRQFDAFVAELGRNQTSNLAQRLSPSLYPVGGLENTGHCSGGGGISLCS